MKSSWAYNNGQREMKQALSSNLAPKTGWVNGKYAERSKYSPDKLWIKGYANKTQCLAKIEKLKAEGINCGMSATHPFTINLIK